MRDISDRVLAELQDGKSRTEIFQNLRKTQPQDTGKIAYCIASIPEDPLRERLLKHNALLCLLLIAYSVLTLLVELPIEPDQPTLFILIKTILPLLFLYFVFRFHGGIYRLAAIWSLIDLLEAVLLTGAPNGTAALRVVVIFLVVVLAFHIGRNGFPNLGILGPKKDASGNYLL